MKHAKYALVGFVLSLAWLAPAEAREGGHHESRKTHRHNPWHGEIHRFHEHDLALWRGGHWHHGRHVGQLGWWWIVGGVWYFYPAAVYPYPDPYQPPVVIVPPTETAPQYWYYCNNPAGYYPYVAQCSTGWQRVAANPSSQASPALPVPPPNTPQ
ncbi:MAG: hypothetical protein WC073_05435 [Sterolibacterium sp.]